MLLSAFLRICCWSWSEVVFWIDEWSIAFDRQWFGVARVHDHSPLCAQVEALEHT